MILANFRPNLRKRLRFDKHHVHGFSPATGPVLRALEASPIDLPSWHPLEVAGPVAVLPLEAAGVQKEDLGDLEVAPLSLRLQRLQRLRALAPDARLHPFGVARLFMRGEKGRQTANDHNGSDHDESDHYGKTTIPV